ncbi:MAG TPA: cytochrome C oxidase subunit IV family protein [Acidimicrobiales bacterium]
MSTTHADVHEPGTPDDETPLDDSQVHSEYSHHSDWIYIRIAVVLALLTALEVSTYYVDFGPVFLPMLFILMAIKFVLVVLFFMHLKYDAKLFGRLFWSGFFLAIAVYVGALATFQMFVN